MKKRILSLLLVATMLLSLVPMTVFAGEKKPVDEIIYWGYANNTLYLSATEVDIPSSCDPKGSFNSIEGFSYDETVGEPNYPWLGIRPLIRHAEILNEIVPGSTAYWFFALYADKIVGIEKLNTSNVTNMDSMFANSYLTELDVSGFDTSNVKDMHAMFAGCVYLESLDVSGIDTSGVTNMNGMFGGCEKLKSLDVSGFDTSSVTHMNEMFFNCEAIESLDVSNFDTSKVDDEYGMYCMFSGCKLLKSLDVSGFDTSKVKNMKGMFNYCSALKALDVSGFDTSNVTDMCQMFNMCSSLESLDVSHFDTSNVKNMESMFCGCSLLKTIDVSHFVTSKVTDMYSMFSGCAALESVDLSSFNTSQVTTISNMFRRCLALKEIDLSGFDCTNVTDATGIFNLNTPIILIETPKNLKVAAPLPKVTAPMKWLYADTLAEYETANLPTNSANSITLVAGVPVDGWDALQNAINEAPGDEATPATKTINFILSKDMTAPDGASSITIPAYKDIAIDLNGHVLNAGGKCGVIKVNAGGKLTVIDSLPATEHYFTVGDDGLWTLAGTKTESTKTVKGGVITGGYDIYFGGVYVSSNGVLNMNGGSIVGNTATGVGNVAGGGVNCQPGSSFTMTNSSICGNVAASGAGGVNGSGSESSGKSFNFTMTNSSVCGNTCPEGTGGVSLTENANFTMINSSIADNVGGEEDVGGVCVSESSFTMTDSSITGNMGGISGGVCVSDGSFTIINSRITDNTADMFGGGVLVFDGEVVLGGTTVIEENLVGETASNLVLFGSNPVTLGTGTDVPKDGMSVGVTMATPGTFTGAATETQKGYFSSDNSGYEVVFSTDHLELKEVTATSDWTAWEPFGTGKGVWKYSVASTGESYVKVYVRTSKSDEKLKQLKLEGWGKGTLTVDGIDLIVDWNETTGNITISEQTTGYYHSAYSEYVMIQDYKSKTGGDVPCTYDSSTGTFSFAVSYYVSLGIFGSSYETLTMISDVQYNIYMAPGNATTPATEPTTITLEEDLTLTSSLIIPVGKNIILDLNGHVLNANGGNFYAIGVKPYAQLTIIDGNTATEHAGYVDANGLWHLGEKSPLGENETAKTIQGGVITGSNQSAIYVDVFGTLIMNGGSVAGNTSSTYAGGIFNESGTFTMNGGSILFNVGDCGGGVMTMGDFSMGGVGYSTTFTMNGGYITDNTATRSGGGVYTQGNFIMTGGSITDNTAKYGGGIINFKTLKLTAAEGKTITITGNTAEYGGGVNNHGEMHISGKVIVKDNVCTGKYNDDTVNYPANIQTHSAVIIDGALTGSEIYITHTNSDTQEHDLGVLTSGFTTQNSGAKLGDFFTYDGPSNFAMVLNDSGELEVMVAHVHNIVKVEGQSATEEEAGWSDYYECKDSTDACHKYFEDATAKVEITDLNAWKAQGGKGYIAPLVHSITPVNGKNATDTEAGYKPYYECKNCGKYYEDATGHIEITDIDAWKSQTGKGYIPSGNEINAAKTAAKAALDSENAKDALLDETALTNGKSAIDSAETLADIENAKNAAITAIQQAQATELDAAKASAKSALDTEEAKDPLTDKTALTNGKDSIDEATTKAAVEEAKNNALEAIKNAQKSELDAAKASAKTALDTEEAKDPLTDKTALTNGKDNIDGATTKAAVEEAKNNALEAIKNAQKSELDAAKASAKSALDTEEAKDPLTDKTALTNGKNSIDGATTKAAVEAAKNAAITAIQEAQATEHKDPKDPDAGDTSNMTLWVMLLALSSMGLCACLVLGKKSVKF